jgi:uncharacterized Zn ribbon protein
MSSTPACPQCHSDVTYDDGTQFVCAECTHDIDCKIDGFGAMKLKSEFVKKA